jgi:hypothetical protein
VLIDEAMSNSLRGKIVRLEFDSLAVA